MKKLLALIGFAMLTSFAMAADYREGMQYDAITPLEPLSKVIPDMVRPEMLARMS